MCVLVGVITSTTSIVMDDSEDNTDEEDNEILGLVERLDSWEEQLHSWGD